MPNMLSISTICARIDEMSGMRLNIDGGRPTWRGDPRWSVTLDFREQHDSGERGLEVSRTMAGDDLVAVLNEVFASVTNTVKKGIGPRALMPPEAADAE